MKILKCLSAIIFLLVACTDHQPDADKKDQIKDSTIRISIDESFEPVIREQVKVFESAYPDVKVIAEYKPEAECLRDLQNDSTKIVIISRELSRIETKFFDEKIEYKPEFGLLARDAVAVIINSAGNDSIFYLNDIKQFLNGTDKRYNIALDGKSSTSTVRYLKDSLLKGGAFSNNITGANNSEDLINYIASTPKAIGFVALIVLKI